MYFDRPGLILLVLLVIFGPLSAHAVVKAMNNWRNPTGADAVFSFLTLLFSDSLVVLIVLNFLAQMHDEYERLKGYDGRPSIVPEPQPQRTIPNLNSGKALYPFQVTAVKIDPLSRKIKHFCIVLINQRDNGFKIDLREVTWKSHFGGHDNYVNVRDVRLAGAFAKESSRTNSPFIVVDWRIVEQAANGRM